MRNLFLSLFVFVAVSVFVINAKADGVPAESRSEAASDESATTDKVVAAPVVPQVPTKGKGAVVLPGGKVKPKKDEPVSELPLPQLLLPKAEVQPIKGGGTLIVVKDGETEVRGVVSESCYVRKGLGGRANVLVCTSGEYPLGGLDATDARRLFADVFKHLGDKVKRVEQRVAALEDAITDPERLADTVVNTRRFDDALSERFPVYHAREHRGVDEEGDAESEVPTFPCKAHPVYNHHHPKECYEVDVAAPGNWGVALTAGMTTSQSVEAFYRLGSVLVLRPGLGAGYMDTNRFDKRLVLQVTLGLGGDVSNLFEGFAFGRLMWAGDVKSVEAGVMVGYKLTERWTLGGSASYVPAGKAYSTSIAWGAYLAMRL